MNLEESKGIIKNTPPEFNIAQPRVMYFEAKAFLQGYEHGVRDAAEQLDSRDAHCCGDCPCAWNKEKILKLLDEVKK